MNNFRADTSLVLIFFRHHQFFELYKTEQKLYPKVTRNHVKFKFCFFRLCPLFIVFWQVNSELYSLLSQTRGIIKIIQLNVQDIYPCPFHFRLPLPLSHPQGQALTLTFALVCDILASPFFSFLYGLTAFQKLLAGVVNFHCQDNIS